MWQKIFLFIRINWISFLILLLFLFIGLFCAFTLSIDRQTQISTSFLFPSLVVSLIVWTTIGVNRSKIDAAVKYTIAQNELDAVQKASDIKSIISSRDKLTPQITTIIELSEKFVNAHRQKKSIDTALFDKYSECLNIVIGEFDYINNDVLKKYKDHVANLDSEQASYLVDEDSYIKTVDAIIKSLKFFNDKNSPQSIEAFFNDLNEVKEIEFQNSYRKLKTINDIYFVKIVPHWLEINMLDESEDNI